MAALIDGPRLAAKSRATKQLVVFLHGYGADGNDLIAIARQWQALMPDAAFVSPHAPEPCVQSPGGRQWFALTMHDPNERWAGVNKAAPGINAFLDAELQRHRLDDAKLALVGFSQGAMLALHAGLRRQRPPAAIISYSGEFVSPPQAAAANAPVAGVKAAPVLLLHGSEDDVIPVDALFASTESLAEAGVPNQWHLAMGLGHGIDQVGLTQGGLFLAQRFKLKPGHPPKARA